MTQPPGPDESTGPAQPSEPVPPVHPGQQRETAPPEETTPSGAVPPTVPPETPPTTALPGIRPPAPGETGVGGVPQPGYPEYPGQAAPGGYPAQPQYPAGGYDQSQGYPAQYDPSQPYVIYQAMPAGGVYAGALGDDDPLVSPDYSGWWRRTLAIVRQGWRSLAVLQLIGFLLSLLISVPQALLVLNLSRDLDTVGTGVNPDTGAPVMPDFGKLFGVLGLTLVGSFLAIMVTFAVAIACNHVAVSVAAGLQPRLGAALGLAARRVFPLIGWQILAGLIVLAGICACVLPAIYLSAVFMLLPAVVTFERGGSAISRCFKLFHQDLGASISRIATIAGIGIGIGVVAYIINMLIQYVPGQPTFDPRSSSPFGGVDSSFIVAIVIGTVLAELLARVGAVLTAPLTLTAYADLRARVETTTTASLANEAGLAPAYPQPQYGEEPVQPPPGQDPSAPNSDWNDGGPATAASLNMPHEIQFDADGNLYIAERDNHVVRKVAARTGVISTFAGTNVAGFSGDGGPADRAQLRQPHSIAIDRQNRLLICDIGNQRIRRVDLATGIIETYAGTGVAQPTPDGAPVKGTPLNGPRTMVFDEKGDIYLALREGNAIYRIAAAADTLHHVAGTGKQGYSGDGGPARAAELGGPKGLAYRGGALYVADTENHVIRTIDIGSGIINTVIGTGQRGDGPETDPLQCRMSRPHGLTVDAAGVLYVTDSEAHRIRVLK